MMATNNDHDGHNHDGDGQRHNLVKFVQRCLEFGEILKVRR